MNKQKLNPNLKQRILRKTHSYFWVARKKLNRKSKNEIY